MNEQYKQLGVSDAVLAYGETILASLRERFDAIDAIAGLVSGTLLYFILLFATKGIRC